MSSRSFFALWGIFFLVTGALGACALNPTILTLSVWIILPALVLCLSANHFLWGWIFFIAALLGRGRSTVLKVGLHLVAATIVATAVYTVPRVWNRLPDAEASRLTQDDKAWHGSLAGITTLALLMPHKSSWQSPTGCSLQCHELLYSGAFAAILVGAPPSFGLSPDSAQTLARFRIEHGQSCHRESWMPDAILRRQAQGDCIVQDSAPLSDAGAAWILSEMNGYNPWDTMARRRSLNIHTGSEWAEVSRTTETAVQHYITPLLLGPVAQKTSSDKDTFGLGFFWWRGTLGDNSSPGYIPPWEAAIPGLPAPSA